MRCPPEYPYVIVNMAMSADGKISTRRREPITLGTARDRLLMDQLRARADAVIIGAGTLRVDGYPLLVRNSVIRRRRIARGVEPHPVNILLSRSLDIPTRRLFFTDPNTRKIVYTRRAANPLKRKQLARYVEFVLVPGRSSFLKYVLRDLAGRGLRKVLVEGGGELNFSFFKEGLVDELYLTVTPRILGGGKAPTVVDGSGFLKHNHLKISLRSARRVGDELFLRYKVGPAAG